MNTLTKGVGWLLKLGLSYYFAGLVVTILRLTQSQSQNPHISLGLLWPIVPIFEPYDSILWYIIAGKEPAMAGGWGFIGLLALSFIAAFYLAFMLLSRIGRHAEASR